MVAGKTHPYARVPFYILSNTDLQEGTYTPTRVSELKHDKWVGTTYGNGWMHRWLIRLLRVTDVRLLYAFASVFVVPPTLLVNAPARRAIYSYFRRRWGYGPLRAAWMTVCNHCAFSQVVIDRFAMYAGRRFHIDIDGYGHFLRLASRPEGFVQLSSHIGNYEIAGYSLAVETKRFNALVFGGEKASVMANRNRMFSGNNIRMIPMSADMSHMFMMDAALADGEILSMPADRIFGSQKYYEMDFLGAPARFPQGAFQLAAVRRVPVLFVAVMKQTLTSYRIIVREIPSPAEGTAKERARALAEAYVAELEDVVRQYPTQWYNYFDFWAQ